MKNNIIKPFLKWVGGKSRLVNQLLPMMPNGYNIYREPFLGSGALFFALQPKRAILSDSNADLINTFVQLRDRSEDLIYVLNALQKHYYKQSAQGKKSIYALMVAHFNSPENYDPIPEYERAAQFIFLNKTSFSGLYRVNSDGKFNVPFGKYERPNICNEYALLCCAEALRDTNILCREFSQAVPRAKSGDFVYCDPPYLPSNSDNSNFVGYSKNGFNYADQAQLAVILNALTKKGANWLVSNSDAPQIYEMYKPYIIKEIFRLGTINSDSSKRDKVKELVIRNY